MASQKFADRSREGLAIVKMLLKAKALPDVKKMGGDNSTALHDAARRGAFDIVRLLLKHGASASETDIFGHTPLHVLASVKNVKDEYRKISLDIVKILLDAGADPVALDFAGNPPHFYTCDDDLRMFLKREDLWRRRRLACWCRKIEGNDINYMLPEHFSKILKFL